MIDDFPFLIEIKMSIDWHGSFDNLGIHHVKLLEHIIGVHRLANESSILHLLDLKSKEELQFTHHRYLKSLGNDPTKFLTKRMTSTTKYYVIDIYLAHKYIFTNFMSEKGRIGFAYFKALFKQEFLKAFIPCSWCLLEPIEQRGWETCDLQCSVVAQHRQVLE